MITIKILSILMIMFILYFIGKRNLKHALKEQLVYISIVLTAGTLSVIRIFEISVPSPLHFVVWAYKPISDLILLLQ